MLLRAASWVVAIIIVPTAMAAAISVSLPDEVGGELRRLHPLDVGTTWVYAVTSGGDPSGTRTRQVLADAALGVDTPQTVAIRSHYTDYVGTGPRTNLVYLGLQADGLYQHGLFDDNTHSGLTPAAPVYQLPVAVGKPWSYRGTLGEIKVRYTSQVLAIEDIEVSGRTFTDCAHYATDTRLRSGDVTSKEHYEEWTCPGFGPVRSHTVNVADGLDTTEELVAFRGPDNSWGRTPPTGAGLTATAPPPGDTVGFDSARSNALPDAAMELHELAWTDGRRVALDFPPVGADGILVAGEVDGTVSATDTADGQTLWRVRLAGPIVAPPVIAHGAVLVADAEKNLWALEMATGAARWVDHGHDQVSVAPAVFDDVAVVVRGDRTTTALRLRDGVDVWQHRSAGLVRATPAAAAGRVVIVSEDGTIAALRARDGLTLWHAETSGIHAAGPAIREGVAIVTDTDGVVYGFAADSGELMWERRLGDNVVLPPALAHGRVVVLAGSTRLLALNGETGDHVWESRLDEDSAVPPAIIGGDVVTVSADGGTVRTWDAATGAPKGRRDLPRPTPDAQITTDVALAVIGSAVVFTSGVFAEGHGATMTALPLTMADRVGDSGLSGGIALRTRVRAVPSPPYAVPALVNDVLYVAGQDKVLYRSAAGEAERVHTTKGAQPFTVGTGDAVLAQKDSELVALPLDGGAPRWSFPVAEPFPGSVPAVSGNTVFVPEHNLGLAAADLATGTPTWFQPIANATGTTSPVPLPGGDVVHGSGGLARYDGATGAPGWRIDDVQLFSSAAYDDGVVFAAAVRDAHEPALLAVDAETGDILWQKPNPELTLVAGPAAAEGVVVYADAQGAVTAYRGHTGETLWSFQTETAVGGTPFIFEGKVYLSEIGREEDLYQREFRVVVKDLATGRFLGSFQPPGQGYQQFPAIGPAAEGILAVPATNRLGSIVMLLEAADD